MLILIALFVFSGAREELQHAIQRQQYEELLQEIARRRGSFES
jgi:hypothetical protein